MNIQKYWREYLSMIAWPMFVFSIHLIGQLLYIYNYLPWLDTPMHFFGGMAIATSSLYLFAYLEKRQELQTTRIIKIFLAIAITALVAMLWEFAEYGGDLLFATHMQPSIYDTMKDLCMGLLGATAASLPRIWFQPK